LRAPAAAPSVASGQREAVRVVGDAHRAVERLGEIAPERPADFRQVELAFLTRSVRGRDRARDADADRGRRGDLGPSIERTTSVIVVTVAS